MRGQAVADGHRGPARSVAVLDEETFLRGRGNPEEGGPKGPDIDRSNSVVAITCEERTLAFFSLLSIFRGAENRRQGSAIAPAQCRKRDRPEMELE
ncbi:hypothetical protein FJ938_16745 [Mesorhizobium sp. B2-4-14]|nr:hypothetical protein FJ938_16745 [Mesorhizobium sp. B2-4-14]